MTSSTPRPAHFVSTQWLADNLDMPGLAIVDASWYLPNMNRDGKAEFLAGHIPKAVFFDIDAIADPKTSLPHMLLEPLAFSSEMRKLGIGDGMKIVVYDGAGLFTAPRVWWMLRAYGATDVVILDGGLPKWKAEGRPLDDGPAQPKPRHFTARLNHALVASADDVAKVLASGSANVVDARPAARFRGEAAEPRPGVRSGHMPGSLNVPFTELVTDGHLKPAAQLLTTFEAAGVDWSKPMVTSCGSGVSAAILTLALDVAGKKPGTLYDGSWAEWGSRDDLPVDVG